MAFNGTNYFDLQRNLKLNLLLICGFSSIPKEMALLLCLLEMASDSLFVDSFNSYTNSHWVNCRVPYGFPEQDISPPPCAFSLPFSCPQWPWIETSFSWFLLTQTVFSHLSPSTGLGLPPMCHIWWLILGSWEGPFSHISYSSSFLAQTRFCLLPCHGSEWSHTLQLIHVT